MARAAGPAEAWAAAMGEAIGAGRPGQMGALLAEFGRALEAADGGVRGAGRAGRPDW